MLNVVVEGHVCVSYSCTLKIRGRHLNGTHEMCIMFVQIGAEFVEIRPIPALALGNEESTESESESDGEFSSTFSDSFLFAPGRESCMR